VRAGAELLYTDSFGASSVKLGKTSCRGKAQQLNRLAVETARAAAPGVLIFGSMGPLGELLDPHGDLSEDTARAAFREQAQALVGAGADGIAIETHSDAREVTIAIEEARAAGAGFVISTMSFDGPDRKFKTMMGVSPEEAAQVMAAAGADAIGANCGAVVSEMPDVMRRMGAAAPGVWLVTKANAGLPIHENGNTIYPMRPKEFSEVGERLLASGVRMIGGCCGTTPEHIAALREVIAKK
jgi:5-methyltetrahydrofolate--homocysteine methyltransferase